MKIVFVGTVEFSYRMLRKLLEMKENIVGVVTKESSVFNSDFVNIGDFCRQQNINVRFTKDINSAETFQWIQSLSPDIIFCFGWSSLIKRELLDLPHFGVIGYHPAALPKNRGRHPLIWALVLGLSETASTFFFMDEGADSGNIVSQKTVIITPVDDATTLYQKMVNIASLQIEEFVPLLKNNTTPIIVQDHTKATYWRKRTKYDGQIDWRMSVKTIYNLVRALTNPYVGSHFIYKGKEIKVWKVIDVSKYYLSKDIENIEYGKVISIDKENSNLDVKCSDGVLRILSHSLNILPNLGDYLL